MLGKAILPMLCLLLAGCAAAVFPMKKRTESPQGKQENVHLDFLHVGQTTRAEVLEKLKPFDIGVSSERFFLGRWTSSTWAWFVVTTQNGAGGRHWGTTNLLIEFDGNGLVKKFEHFSDKDLNRELGPIVEDSQPLEPAARVELLVSPSYIPGDPLTAKIILSGGALEFDGVCPCRKPAHFTVPASKVSKVSSIGPMIGGGPDPAYSSQVIHFSEALKPFGGPKGKRVFVRIKPLDLVTLLNYIKTNGGHASKVAQAL